MSAQEIQNRRKRARYRAWHRGTREMDLLLGPFADRRLERCSPDEIEEFERLLEVSDVQLMQWFTGAVPVPESHDSAICREILQMCKGSGC